MKHHSLTMLRLGLCVALLLGGLPVVSFAPTKSAQAQSLSVITIEVSTADTWYAGTDDTVHLVFLVGSGNSLQTLEWDLDTDDNDFEKGDTNTFRLTSQLPFTQCELKFIQITKSEDGIAGGWKLGGIKIYANDDASQVIYQNGSINQWLEDNHRDWLASDFQATACPAPLPPAPKTPPKPSTCTVDKIDPQTQTKKQLSDQDCDGLANEEDPDPRTPAKDSDGDGIPDPREKLMGTDPNNPDSDGDGVPDGFEDKNWDGKLDPGESDPKKRDTDGDGIADGSEDSDQDGLPDWYEVTSDPKNPDSDDDGWFDGPKNTRTTLILYQIECINDNEDSEAGDDELFLVIDNVRFPADSEDLDGYWSMDDDDVIHPMAVVGRRVRSPKKSASYQVAVEFWEDDLYDFTDDQWKTYNPNFSESGTFSVKYEDYSWNNDTIYNVTFLLYNDMFYDPDPASGKADLDQDGLSDFVEYGLSGNVWLRGLSDPGNRDIFLEMDWVGEGEEPEEYSKIDVVSQYYYHGYPIHFDDGDYNGGGENVAEDDKVWLFTKNGTPSAEQFADMFFAAERRGKFHYVLAVDVVGEYQFGASTLMICNDSGKFMCGSEIGLMIFKSDYLDHISDMESILFMHELGHTFGLCHRPEDPTPVVAAGGSCPDTNPANCGNCVNCTHYWIDQESDTAMGSGLPFEGDGAAAGAFIGLAGGAAIGAAIGGPAGAVVGGVIGLIGGIFAGGYLKDPLDREIRYEDVEWEALNLEGIQHWK